MVLICYKFIIMIIIMTKRIITTEMAYDSLTKNKKFVQYLYTNNSGVGPR